MKPTYLTPHLSVELRRQRERRSAQADLVRVLDAMACVTGWGVVAGLAYLIALFIGVIPQ